MTEMISSKRIISSIFWDIKIQIRYGFYYVALIAALVWISALWFVSNEVKREFIGVFLLSNLNLGTFLFAAGLILFEKGDNTLDAMVVTPLRSSEYLISKIGSLFILALIENMFIILILFRDIQINYLPVILGIFVMSSTYILFGIGFSVKYPDFTEFIFPAILMITILELPIMRYVGLDGGLFSILYYFLPTNPSLVLTELSIYPIEPFTLLYGVVGSVFWIVIATYYCLNNFSKFITRREKR